MITIQFLVTSTLLNLALAVPTHHWIKRAPSASKSPAIVSLFQWNWDSVQNECPFLAQAGYGYVQVSPPHEHISGGPWWTDYQVVSYTLQSKRGSRDQFASMVNACNGVGVQVIVDVVANHMTALDSGTGVAGHSFTHYNYPGTYSSQDFHYCGTPNNAIVDWNDEYQLENCELLRLADLNTESESVRSFIAQYLNDLLSLGVSGFRVDAAKHIAPASVTNILSRLSRQVYITQEVTDTTGVYVNKHQNAGDVQVFNYAFGLKDAFLNSGISSLCNVNNRGWLTSDLANVFVTNHDTERQGTSLNYTSGNNVYTLAHVFLLSYPYGTPTVHSGYGFSNKDQGAPNGNYGTCSSDGSPSNGWECQHRWSPIANMVGFYNQVGNAGLINVVTTSNNQQLAYGRDSAGHVAINNADSPWQATFSTDMANGDYCDVVNGYKNGIECTGIKVTVENGSFTILVPLRQAIAIHTGAKL